MGRHHVSGFELGYKHSQSVLRISPVAAEIASIEPGRFTVAMIAPATMSGQPGPVIAMIAAASMVRTFSSPLE